MRLWQRRAHPVLWIVVIAAVVAVAVLLVSSQPSLLDLR